MQGYIQQNASQFPPNYYRPDSRRSSTSYSRTQSESKFSDAKNEPTGSPDQNQNQQQQQQLQNLPPSHTPQFYHMPDGYIYQSPASSVATYDTATAAGSGYQSPEVMMGFPHQFYVGGPPVSEGYQQQQQFQQSGDGEGRKQQQYSSYEDRKQPYEEPTQPENEAQPPSESKISENYITAHTEQNQQHIEYEARNAMNNLNLNENANGATYENYSQNEENETPLNEQENANFDENAGQDVPQNWRKTLDQIQEENLPNDMGASTYAEKRIECSYCRTSGESESVYSSHSLLSPDGKIICSKLQEIGCSICHATGDDVHFERTCPQNEIPTASYLQSLAQQIFTHRGHQHSYKPNGYSPRARIMEEGGILKILEKIMVAVFVRRVKDRMMAIDRVEEGMKMKVDEEDVMTTETDAEAVVEITKARDLDNETRICTNSGKQWLNWKMKKSPNPNYTC
uniref:Nanos-type domain-containing protein n=1 Tax=Acrobeloides nanus TaxID=290746 RepID=A0A914CNY5_9BILA